MTQEEDEKLRQQLFSLTRRPSQDNGGGKIFIRTGISENKNHGPSVLYIFPYDQSDALSLSCRSYSI
jgi:hypothetical protein